MEKIQTLKDEITAWAAERGQEHVAIEICRHWFLLGANSTRVRLHPIEDEFGKADWKAIYNNGQQIFRWLRGESKASRVKVLELAEAMTAALPVERRARLSGVSVQYLLSIAVREFASVVIAILLDACDTHQRIDGALIALRETQRLTNAA